MEENLHVLVHQARQHIGYTAVDFARTLGVSARTVYRHGISAGVPPHGIFYEKIVRALYPKNPVLAAKIAAQLGRDLTAFGIEVPREVAPPPHAIAHHANSVVCAAADAMDKVPRDARPIVSAIFAHVRDLGVDLPSLVELLAQKAK